MQNLSVKSFYWCRLVGDGYLTKNMELNRINFKCYKIYNIHKGERKLQNINRKILVMLLLSILLLTLPAFIITNVRSEPPPPTTIRVDPPSLEVQVDSFFDVFFDVDSFFDVFYYGVVLGYDTNIIDAVDVGSCPPFNVTYKMISDPAGWMVIEGAGGPVTGTAKLAKFRFHCTGAGESALTILEAYLVDPAGSQIPIDKVVNGYVSQTTWYFKASYTDYAPSGVPDFDQKQWGVKMWTNPWPPVGTWSWCGPVSVADSLWWLDSEFEPNPMPPSIINDGFPLVQNYTLGIDDHNSLNVPYLVEDLAWRMDTDGRRTGNPHCGTEVHDMEFGIDWYIHDKGLDWKFYEHTVKAPDFFWIEQEIKRCEDVILLLGFWQENPEMPGGWMRVGGHYVTCAGVDSMDMWLAFSDPFIDGAEMGLCPGIVLPVPGHPHTGPPETLHNDASFVSQDFYQVGESYSPGGRWGLPYYPAEYVIDNFGSCQNTPEEFIPVDGPYNPSEPISTEIEYAVVTSCKTGIVAAGSEDTNIYVWDFAGTLQWQFALANPVVSVAMDNDGRYIAAGTRYMGPPKVTGSLWLFDNSLGGPPGNVLWTKTLNISLSYDGGWAGTESKSVDVKYNYYNAGVVVAAATDQGLYLFDQFGNQIWHYWDEHPETLVRISQDGNYIVCVDYNTGIVHYFSHLRDGNPGWGPNDGVPIWSFGAVTEIYAFWAAISGIGDYVAVSVYPNPVIYNPMTAGVILLDRTGSIVWFYILPKGGYVRVDMPCSGRSVVSVNDDPLNALGCDLLYWSDGGNGWDSGDANPVWSYWPSKELGNPQNPGSDFYTVTISENGDYVATGGAVPTSTYLLDKNGVLQQIIGLGQQNIQSVDLTFTGKYGASVDSGGTIWFFDKDTGFMWSAVPTGAPFHCVAISKLYPCMFPYPNHDVAVTNVKTSKTGCLPIPVLGHGYILKINVTLANQGDYAETFNVIVYANTTAIASQSLSLSNGSSTSIIFSYNTTGLAKGTYTIWATASIVQNEIDVYDNTYTDGLIAVSVVGDINGDFKVDIKDLVLVIKYFGSYPGHPTKPWNPNADINCDNKVDIKDLVLVIKHFGEHYP